MEGVVFVSLGLYTSIELYVIQCSWVLCGRKATASVEGGVNFITLAQLSQVPRLKTENSQMMGVIRAKYINGDADNNVKVLYNSCYNSNKSVW